MCVFVQHTQLLFNKNSVCSASFLHLFNASLVGIENKGINDSAFVGLIWGLLDADTDTYISCFVISYFSRRNVVLHLLHDLALFSCSLPMFPVRLLLVHQENIVIWLPPVCACKRSLHLFVRSYLYMMSRISAIIYANHMCFSWKVNRLMVLQ